MPLRADLLGVRDHRHCNAWAGTRKWTCHLAAHALSPVLPRRIGPGATFPETEANTGTNGSYGTSAAQAYTIERAVCSTAPFSDRALGIRGRRATPQRQEKLFARNSQS